MEPSATVTHGILVASITREQYICYCGSDEKVESAEKVVTLILLTLN